ncbi:MAG: 16S rRNA (adenine(1518)-N(6)/adenine(1519)-N(6))-dimethyltransferase, partial [Gammaproteobacteria bacterium]|nr:16S rRNA (adenine(1518)-N(6)/adenine(1519)-N(6))-dimethyltransferase [Gammaproteobacteria bacterium]
MSRITPRKRFGQHFLTDQVVLESIIRAFSPKRDDRVLEIGPGTGILTEVLLDHLDYLVAIEIDRDMVKHLNQRFS